jgi:hypothetical protein
MLLLLLSSFIFGDTRHWHWKLIGGCMLTLSGFFIYSYGSLKGTQMGAAQTLPVSSSTTSLLGNIGNMNIGNMNIGNMNIGNMNIGNMNMSTQKIFSIASPPAGEPDLPLCKPPQAA